MASGGTILTMKTPPPVRPTNELPVVQEKVETDPSSCPDPAASDKVEEPVKPKEESKGSFKDYRVSLRSRASFVKINYQAHVSTANIPLCEHFRSVVVCCWYLGRHHFRGHTATDDNSLRLINKLVQ